MKPSACLICLSAVALNVGTMSPSFGQTTDVPSDADIISALTTAMNESDDDTLKSAKEALATIDLNACYRDALDGCRTSPNGKGNFRGGLSIYSDRDDCINSIDMGCREDKKQREASIANFHYRSDSLVMTVIKKGDYEGNIIAYVNVRTKGTDDTEEDKISMHLQNGDIVIDSVMKAN